MTVITDKLNHVYGVTITTDVNSKMAISCTSDDVEVCLSNVFYTTGEVLHQTSMEFLYIQRWSLYKEGCL
jgi:hypothetical protein